MSREAADAIVEEANVLFRAEKYAEAIARFERAAQIFPPHALAWKGLGHALLCLGGRTHEAARAFDQSIGLRPDSATALWGGAVAHGELGNKVMAQNYLQRALALQPAWAEMAQGVPALAQFLQVSVRAGEAMRHAWGTFSTRTFRHAGGEPGPTPVGAVSPIEVGRIANQPFVGPWTYATIGLSNKPWPDAGRPRVELVMATLVDTDMCSQILANLAFHLWDTDLYPEPGVVVRDVVGALAAGELSQRLPHILIGVPRAWKLRLPIDELPPVITLAQVIPVSEAECGRWQDDPSGFEADLVLRAIDVSDLRRT